MSVASRSRTGSRLGAARLAIAVAATATLARTAAADKVPDPPRARTEARAETHADVRPTSAAGLAGDGWIPAHINTRDLPGTDGEWQEGSAVIRAPRAEVQRWLTDYPAWPRHFRDITSVKLLGDDERGRHCVRFKSRIAGAEITVAEEVSSDLLVFDGVAWFAFTQGRIHLVDLGDGTTRVLMQSTAQPRGIARLFATKALRRERSYRVARSHLESLDELAHRRARGLPDGE